MASYYCEWAVSKLRYQHFEPGFIGLGDGHFTPFVVCPAFPLLSLAPKKVTKKAAETYYGISFRGATIELECCCGARLINSDDFCSYLLLLQLTYYVERLIIQFLFSVYSILLLRSCV